MVSVKKAYVSEVYRITLQVKCGPRNVSFKNVLRTKLDKVQLAKNGFKSNDSVPLFEAPYDESDRAFFARRFDTYKNQVDPDWDAYEPSSQSDKINSELRTADDSTLLLPESFEADHQESWCGAISLAWARNKIVAKIQEIQKNYMVKDEDGQGFLLPKKNVEPVSREIRNLEALRDCLMDCLERVYLRANGVFDHRLTSQIEYAKQQAIDADPLRAEEIAVDFDSLRIDFFHKFPELETLQRSFRVSNTLPEREPTIADMIASNDSVLTEALEQADSSNIDAAMAQLNQRAYQDILDGHREKIDRLTELFMEGVAEMVQSLEASCDRPLGIRASIALDRHRQQVENYLLTIQGLKGEAENSLETLMERLFGASDQLLEEGDNGARTNRASGDALDEIRGRLSSLRESIADRSILVQEDIETATDWMMLGDLVQVESPAQAEQEIITTITTDPSPISLQDADQELGMNELEINNDNLPTVML